MVEKRQIHETKGSFYLYLPKKWITDNEIDKTKSISLIDYFEDQLILKKDTEYNTPDDNREVVIPLDKINKDKNKLKNYITASYIIGANKITVKSESEIIKPQIREDVAEQVRKLSGFEIIFENDNVIEAKEMSKFLDINSTIQTLFSRTQNMFKQVQNLITDYAKDPDILRTELKIIIKTDDDIDRFKHMVDRLSHLILKDPYLIAMQKLDTIKILHDTQIASHIERIADHIVELTRYLRSNVSELEFLKEEASNEVDDREESNDDTDDDDYEEGSSTLEKPETRFSKAIDFYTKAIDFFTQLSNFYIKTELKYLNALDLYKEIHIQEKIIQKELKKEKFNFVFYHIGRIFSYCENIAEILINQSAYELYNPKKD